VQFLAKAFSSGGARSAYGISAAYQVNFHNDSEPAASTSKRNSEGGERLTATGGQRPGLVAKSRCHACITCGPW
jgi:hypothetical protein